MGISIYAGKPKWQKMGTVGLLHLHKGESCKGRYPSQQDLYQKLERGREEINNNIIIMIIIIDTSINCSLEHAFAKVCDILGFEKLNKHQDEAIPKVVEMKKEMYMSIC